MNNFPISVQEQRIIEGLRKLPPAEIKEVEDLVVFLAARSISWSYSDPESVRARSISWPAIRSFGESLMRSAQNSKAPKPTAWRITNACLARRDLLGESQSNEGARAIRTTPGARYFK